MKMGVYYDWTDFAADGARRVTRHSPKWYAESYALDDIDRIMMLPELAVLALVVTE